MCCQKIYDRYFYKLLIFYIYFYVREFLQLFVRFTRPNQAKIEGHGLGLSIVQRIIDQCGGQVGQGSTFYSANLIEHSL